MDNKNTNPKQPESVDFYENYLCEEGSFKSYYYQVKEVLKLNPTSVLVIGQGDNIVPNILRSFVKKQIRVDTFDVIEDMNPTYVGDVRQIDEIVKDKYDVVLCCEVLEHLPFNEFVSCLQKISKVQRKGLVLSLPVFGLSGYIKIWGPKWFRFTIIIAIRYFFGKKVNCDQHYWEINDGNGVKLKDVVNAIEQDYAIKSRYRVKDQPYHMFFVLKTK